MAWLTVGGPQHALVRHVKSSDEPRCETKAVMTCDLITLTFDLSTSKYGHGSTVSWACFLPCTLQLPTPHHSSASVAEWLQCLFGQQKDQGSNPGSAVCLVGVLRE